MIRVLPDEFSLKKINKFKELVDHQLRQPSQVYID